MDKRVCVDTSKISLRQINNLVMRELVNDHQLPRKLLMSSVALGIFQKTAPKESSLFENDNDVLIGCVTYSNPVGRSAAASISELLDPSNVLELSYVWVEDRPDLQNVESYCIGQSFHWLRKNRLDVKALIGYADTETGHIGIIYQSTNWLYQGDSLALMPNWSISLTGPTEYEWIHSRTVSEKFGSSNIEHLQKVIGKTFWRKRESKKNRYVYILERGAARKKLITSLKHKTYPYPRVNNYVEFIEEIAVVEKDTPVANNPDAFFT